MKQLSTIFISFICILLTGCGGSENSTFQTKQSELSQGVSNWNNSGLTTYQYTYRRTCFCPPEEDIIVSVVDGNISEAVYTPSGTQLESSALNGLYTVNDLFSEVQKAINDEVASLDTKYDGHFGYPTLISIDRDRMIVDEEITHEILAFQ